MKPNFLLFKAIYNMAALNFDMGEMELSNKIENVTLSQLLDLPTQQLIEQEVNKQFAIPVMSVDLKVQQEQRIPKKTREANHWAPPWEYGLNG